MYLGKSVTASFSLDGGKTWRDFVNDIPKLKEDSNMNKHPHDKLIRKWLDNYDTHVVIFKLTTNKWEEALNPKFFMKHEYKVIPRKHLDVALAFYNDGAEVQARQMGGGPWITLNCEPNWDCYDYRIEPKVEQKDGEWWMCELPTGDIQCLRYWLRDGDSDGVWNIFQDESMSLHPSATVKPLHKMVQADE